MTKTGSEPMTKTDADIVQAVKNWAIERSPKDAAERLLLATLFAAYPLERHSQENCGCGDPCDECPSEAETTAWTEKVLREHRA